MAEEVLEGIIHDGDCGMAGPGRQVMPAVAKAIGKKHAIRRGCKMGKGCGSAIKF